MSELNMNTEKNNNMQEDNSVSEQENKIDSTEVENTSKIKKQQIIFFIARVLFFAVIFAVFIIVILGSDAIIEWVKSLF